MSQIQTTQPPWTSTEENLKEDRDAKLSVYWFLNEFYTTRSNNPDRKLCEAMSRVLRAAYPLHPMTPQDLLAYFRGKRCYEKRKRRITLRALEPFLNPQIKLDELVHAVVSDSPHEMISDTHEDPLAQQQQPLEQHQHQPPPPPPQQQQQQQQQQQEEQGPWNEEEHRNDSDGMDHELWQDAMPVPRFIMVPASSSNGSL
jgi:hypothetical protein